MRSSWAGPTGTIRGRAGQSLDELVEHRIQRDHPRRRRALLARVRERAVRDRRDRDVEVGVGVDDDRVLAPHLGQDPLDLSLPGSDDGRALDDLQADRLRAGERDERDRRVLDQRRADLLADAGEEGEHTRRDARLVEDLDQTQRDRRASAPPA